ncbi:hypothetical protein ACYZX9_16480 [Sphingomonas citri]|uniref:Hemerythrin-like domain-containing protein n=2 Tax=Sphingomonas citri TaxID=2862499 RepID=A0ABS7BL62_9SPHN|nr:hypothetical protein [Sphingomonas citri]
MSVTQADKYMKAIHVAEHRQMLDLAAAILAETSAQQPCRRDSLGRLRLSFSRLVNTHCEAEGRSIRAAVNAGLLCPRVAATFHRELQQWRAALVCLNGAWSSARIEHDQSGFASAFRPLAEDLRSYIEREETQVLDKLQLAS